MKSRILFREKQALQTGSMMIALAVPPLFLLGVTLRQMVWRHPWNAPAMTNGNLIFLTALMVAVYFRLITVRLVTELRAGSLVVAMKGLWRRVELPLPNISSATVVHYDAVTEYGGYGIRRGPRGRAYIAAGDQAVQLELCDGQKLLIGSQRPDELARRIRSASGPCDSDAPSVRSNERISA